MNHRPLPLCKFLTSYPSLKIKRRFCFSSPHRLPFASNNSSLPPPFLGHVREAYWDPQPTSSSKGNVDCCECPRSDRQSRHCDGWPQWYWEGDCASENSVVLSITGMALL